MGAAMATREATWLELENIDIERLVNWVYAKQRADVIIDHGVGLWPIERGQSGAGSLLNPVAEVMQLGCRVDGGGVMRAGNLHPDAETVHTTLRKLVPGHVMAVIVQHGRAGSRPDWSDAVPRPMPVCNGHGQPRVFNRIVREGVGWNAEKIMGMRQGRDGAVIGGKPRGGYEAIEDRAVQYCDVEWYPHPSFIDMINSTYAAWWQGLRDLAGALAANGLRQYHPFGPTCPQEPWRQDISRIANR